MLNVMMLDLKLKVFLLNVHRKKKEGGEGLFETGKLSNHYDSLC